MSNLIKANFIAKVNISLLQTAEIVKMQKCYLFTHGAPRSSQELIQNMSIHSGIELEFGNVEKPEYPEKNLSEQSREPATNSTHIWCRVRELKPGHIGGRWALSPLHNPCSPNCGPKWWENAGRQIMEMMSLFFLHKQSRRVEEVEKATPDVPKIKQPETKLKFWLLLLLLLSIVLLLILF